MKKKPGRKNKRPYKTLFEMLYYQENVTADDLAKEWGVSKQTIYNWACKYRKDEL